MDSDLGHFLEKHCWVVLFSIYFSIKDSHTDPLFLHWKWIDIPGSQLEKPEEKKGSECFIVCNQWSSSPEPGRDSHWQIPGTRTLQDSKGQSLWHRKKENTVTDVIWGWAGCKRFSSLPTLPAKRSHGSLPGWPRRCSLPISLFCSVFPSSRMSSILGWPMERVPWLCWSQEIQLSCYFLSTNHVQIVTRTLHRKKKKQLRHECGAFTFSCLY